MPLKPGKSNEIIVDNIMELIKSGYKKDQAVAIALKKAGRNKGQIKSKSKPKPIKR